MSPDETVTHLILPHAPIETRRADIERKQAGIARLLADAECEGLLLLEPANFRWFTNGAMVRGTMASNEYPALFVNNNQRWLLCSSVDTQRFFDEELDGLGFQVKEWPWTGNREQHLADLCFARKIACDRSFKECKFAGSYFEQERRRLGSFETEQLNDLGRILAHALEATARNITVGDSEEEIAGQLAHRLVKRGAEPCAIQVAADDRTRHHRRPASSAIRLENSCVLQATAGKHGLYATASRSICFGAPADSVRAEYDTAARLSAYWLSGLKAGERPSTLLEVARQLLKNSPLEHEWRLSPPGWWTGRSPAESVFTRNGSEKIAEGNAVVFRAQIGGSVVCDTFVLRPDGWVAATPVEEWPVRRYTLQGNRYDRPDLLDGNAT